MTVAMVMIPAFILYAGLMYLFIRRYLRDWVVSVTPATGAATTHRLARFIQGVLHLVHSLTFFVAVVWPPIWVISVLSKHGIHNVMEMKVFSGFYLDLAQSQGVELTGLSDALLRGTMEVTAQANMVQWFLYAVGKEVQALMLLFIVLHLRNIFASICNDEAFTTANALRLKRVGIVLFAAYLVDPLWQFWTWGMVINGIHIDIAGFSFSPAFNPSFRGLFVALVVLVLSGVLAEAVRIQEEQRLTI